jgi:hypothetical protein
LRKTQNHRRRNKVGRQGGFAMNQYELENAARKVEGYDLRVKPNQSRDVEFAAAKQECLKHLRDQLAHVESLEFEQYLSVRKERSALAKAGA